MSLHNVVWHLYLAQLSTFVWNRLCTRWPANCTYLYLTFIPIYNRGLTERKWKQYGRSRFLSYCTAIESDTNLNAKFTFLIYRKGFTIQFLPRKAGNLNEIHWQTRAQSDRNILQLRHTWPSLRISKHFRKKMRLSLTIKQAYSVEIFNATLVKITLAMK